VPLLLGGPWGGGRWGGRGMMVGWVGWRAVAGAGGGCWWSVSLLHGVFEAVLISGRQACDMAMQVQHPGDTDDSPPAGPPSLPRPLPPSGAAPVPTTCSLVLTHAVVRCGAGSGAELGSCTAHQDGLSCMVQLGSHAAAGSSRLATGAYDCCVKVIMIHGWQHVLHQPHQSSCTNRSVME
jgi:hypothetical protein